MFCHTIAGFHEKAKSLHEIDVEPRTTNATNSGDVWMSLLVGAVACFDSLFGYDFQCGTLMQKVRCVSNLVPIKVCCI